MDGSGTTIRHVRADEVEAFRRIRLEALRTEPSLVASRYEDWQALSLEEWRNRLNEPVFIAFQGDEPVGITGLGAVEVQGFFWGLFVIQAADGTICADGRPMGENGTTLPRQAV